MKTFLLTLILFCAVISSVMAQGTAEVEMADTLRSSGMIYVVVSVISIIILGLLTYLFGMDRRIGKIEKSKSAKN